MIPQLASPSVCVIDDEESEYRPILDALLRLGLGCVHVRGDNQENLPPQPFKGLRVVFTDLHLGAHVGKDAASHTANVFKSVVSQETAPVVVVIWSKYANDVPGGERGLPPEDQPTEAELFRQALLTEVPQFRERLVFLEMRKPRAGDRPEGDAWVDNLKRKIQETLSEVGAFDVLWGWESLMRDAGIEVSRNLVDIASAISDQARGTSGNSSLNGRLQLLLKLLTQQQGGPDCSESTAARHLLTALSQLGQEKLEAAASDSRLNAHGNWLSERLDGGARTKFRPSQLNALILTTTAASSFASFPPGMVYKITNGSPLMEAAGYSLRNLQRDCFDAKDPEASSEFDQFCQRTELILLEISPACDFHQRHRRSAMLLAGLTCPADLMKKAKSKDACKITPVFEDRFSDPASDVALVFCSRYRLIMNHDAHPDWLRPWIRLRDHLMADIRNWHAGQTARAGYLYF
jgi:hypothetical protein